jgi:hypothetical protein
LEYQSSDEVDDAVAAAAWTNIMNIRANEVLANN